MGLIWANKYNNFFLYLVKNQIIMKKGNLLKSVLFTIAFSLLLVSCGDDSSPVALAKKRIFQKVDADGMGMLKDLKIISVEMINDSTYKAIHTFTNPMMSKEMRITRNYFFTSDSDSIKNQEDLKVEIKSKGEWIKAGF
jgi:hypothetical protein|tara:strand:- start:601 stop:1017 length:417 start_codon:yes stop_codon:yes gene_type:complete